MNAEATFTNALIGAIGYLVLQLVAPLGVGIGTATLSLWLVPLIGIHLWPRFAAPGWSVLFILLIGFLADLATGLRLGTSSLIGLALFWAVRPDLRSEDAGELRMWLSFAVVLTLIMTAVAILTGEWRQPIGLFLDVAVPILLFPLVFRALRLARGRTPESREAFP